MHQPMSQMPDDVVRKHSFAWTIFFLHYSLYDAECQSVASHGGDVRHVKFDLQPCKYVEPRIGHV